MSRERSSRIKTSRGLYILNTSRMLSVCLVLLSLILSHTLVFCEEVGEPKSAHVLCESSEIGVFNPVSWDTILSTDENKYQVLVTGGESEATLNLLFEAFAKGKIEALKLRLLENKGKDFFARVLARRGNEAFFANLFAIKTVSKPDTLAFLALGAKLPQLSSVNLECKDVPVSDLCNKLNTFASLKSLSLNHLKTDIETFENLKKLKQGIDQLSLGFIPIANLEELRCISEKKLWENLHVLAEVKSISIRCGMLFADFFDQIRKNPKLQDLSLDNCVLDPSSSDLSSCAGLRKLSIDTPRMLQSGATPDECYFEQDFFEKHAGIPVGLEELNISMFIFSETKSLEKISRSSSLKSLRIASSLFAYRFYSMFMGEEILQKLLKIPTLESITVSVMDIMMASPAFISNLNSKGRTSICIAQSYVSENGKLSFADETFHRLIIPPHQEGISNASLPKVKSLWICEPTADAPDDDEKTLHENKLARSLFNLCIEHPNVESMVIFHAQDGSVTFDPLGMIPKNSKLKNVVLYSPKTCKSIDQVPASLKRIVLVNPSTELICEKELSRIASLCKAKGISLEIAFPDLDFESREDEDIFLERIEERREF